MPEYVVGLDSCICKKPNVRSRFGALSRLSKAIGFITYSPEFGMFSYIEFTNVLLWEIGHCFFIFFIYRNDVDVHQLRRYCHFSVTVERYFDLRVEIRSKILLFPRNLYFLGFSLTHRSVVEPYALCSCGRRLWKKHVMYTRKNLNLCHKCVGTTVDFVDFIIYVYLSAKQVY